MNYDFQTLSPDEFEALVSDLFSAEWGSLLESYKPGKDSGIDLLHSRIIGSQERTIVQCKRYATLGFNQLLRSFKGELDKIKKLQPIKYIIATSVNLSNANKMALIGHLHPWVRDTGDIYGQAELNALLKKHEQVARAHFKLWISSTTVLETILNSRIFNFTQFTLEETQKEMCRLVIHDGYERTLAILDKHHHCIFAGNPGIGENYASQNPVMPLRIRGFEPAIVHNDIGDAWALVTRHQRSSDNKIVILYDDFLGQTRYDQLKFSKNEDAQLVGLIKLAERSNNIRFILTSREYIIADARLSHGVFDQHADAISKCIIDLSDYSKAHRAKVLFNHLYFSDLPEDKLEAIVASEIYRVIVAHKYFNPRIIAAISMKANSDSLDAQNFIEFVRSKLDDPADIWDGPFRNEIMPLSRWILTVLWTMGGSADVEKLKVAITALKGFAYEAETVLEFNKCLRELANTFITSDVYEHVSRGVSVTEISFQNPSISDYIEKFLVGESSWLTAIAKTVTYTFQYSQIEKLLAKYSAEGSSHIAKILIQRYQSVPGQPKGDTYRNGQGELVFTDSDLYSQDDEVLAVLKISQRTAIEDIIASSSFHVATLDGWLAKLRRLAKNGAVPYSIRRLATWLVSSEYWQLYSEDIKHSFHQALMNCVHSTPEWCEELSTINILHECTTILGIDLSPLDKLKFQHDADCRAKEILDWDESVQNLEEAAEHLEQLHQRMKFGLKALVFQLREKADSLYIDSSSVEADVDEAIIKPAKADVDFDIDLMFSELLSGTKNKDIETV